MKFCTNCGTPLSDEAKFCSSCGKPCASDERSQATQTVDDIQGVKQNVQASNEGWFDRITRSINEFAGGVGSIRPPLKTIFGGVFKKHSKEDSEEIFICGTAQTTPTLGEDGKAWPSTWLWSRILLAFATAFLLLHLCCATFGNLNAYPGVMVIGAFTVPIAILVFFFELNTPRNISFFNVIKYFLIGGCASLAVTLLLFSLFNDSENQWISAVLTGIVEEVAKLAVVAFIIWNNPKAKYGLNGLLIGAAVGAGFAAFESSGYAFRICLETLLSTLNISAAYDGMVDNILLRAFLAPGGHVIWAAMSGYALMLVKGDKQLSMSFLNRKAFWKIFWIPIALHAVWDMPLVLGNSLVAILIPLVFLILAGWVVTFVFIGNSLSQLGALLCEQEQQIQKEPSNISIEVPTMVD